MVCWDTASYAAAQAERVRRQSWPTHLTPALRHEAELLAQEKLSAVNWPCSSVLGSASPPDCRAGMGCWRNWPPLPRCRPTNTSFLEKMRNVLDQATIIERCLHEQEARLGSTIKSIFAPARFHALAHALLRHFRCEK